MTAGVLIGYREQLARLLTELDLRAVARLVDCLDHTRQRGGTIFVAGNGGSASLAEHFVCDLINLNGRLALSPPFRAISLVSNLASLTALANDEGYETVIAEPLAALARPGDLVILVSASGNSPNVLAAVAAAQRRRAEVFAVTGFDGGRLARRADEALIIATARGEYGPVEDLHLVVDHLVVAALTARHG